MNKKALIIILTGIIFLFLTSQNASAQKREMKFFEIKKIYLEEFEDNKHDDFREMLKNEFGRRMFKFVDTKENADAVLSLAFGFEVTLDGDKDDPHKPIYEFKLSSPSGKVIWEKELKFQTKGSWEKDNKFASKRIIEKFVKDWGESKRKTKN